MNATPAAKPVTSPKLTHLDREKLKGLDKLRKLMPCWEYVASEVIKGDLDQGLLTFAQAAEYQPVVPGTLVRMSDGSYSYLFYVGEDRKDFMPRKLRKPTIEDLVKLAHAAGMVVSCDLVPREAWPRCSYPDHKKHALCGQKAVAVFSLVPNERGYPLCKAHLEAARKMYAAWPKMFEDAVAACQKLSPGLIVDMTKPGQVTLRKLKH